MADISTRRRKRPTFSVSSRQTGAGGLLIPTATISSPRQGREDYFAAMPPADSRDDRRSTPSFYAWNLARRHGSEARTNWIELALRRLDSWGLNTIGNWSDPRLWDTHRKAYQVNLGGWGMRAGYLGLPDVYSEEFPKTVDRDAQTQCAPRKDDSWLLGDFIANEPP